MWKYLIILVGVTANFAVADAKLTASKARVQLPKSRIIGGEEADRSEFPYQVRLENDGHAFCGGALISEEYVLTAAHCANFTENIDVVLGGLDIIFPATGITISAEESIIHENFDSITLQHDIALIKLSKPAAFNQYVGPISLPSKLDGDYLDGIATATGWGLSQDVAQQSLSSMSKVLRKINLRVSDLTRCENYYNKESEHSVTDENICTSGSGDKGICNGDDGGPLALNGVLIGLTSFTTAQCEWCEPSVYTRVASYLDWIDSHAIPSTTTTKTTSAAPTTPTIATTTAAPAEAAESTIVTTAAE